MEAMIRRERGCGGRIMTERAPTVFSLPAVTGVPLGRFSRKDDLLLPREYTSTASMYHSFIQAGAVIITTSGPALWVHAVWKPLHCMCEDGPY